MSRCFLKVGSFSINGNLFDKLCRIKELQELIKSFDIFCCQESWLTEEQPLSVEGYKSNRHKHKAARRASGGVVIFVKGCLVKGVQKICSKSVDLLWIKLSKEFKEFFGMARDLYLVNCYIPPSNSDKSKISDHFGILTEELISYSSKGDTMICGDLNSRTGCR